MSTIRALFALPGLHMVNRGAEVALEETAKQLALREGFRVTLMGGGEPRAGSPYEFVHVPCTPRERFRSWPKFPPMRSEYAWEEATFAWRLRRAFDPRSFDVTIGCSFPFTHWTLRGKGVPHVFVTQNGDWPAQRPNAEYRYFKCDGLVCTNPEYYERHKGTWRSVLIPNGVDVAAHAPGTVDRAALGLPEGVPIVLIVAAHIESKRVLEGIRAVARVPGVHLVAAGVGPLTAQVKKLGEELMPGRFSTFTLPRERMPELYRAASVLLHMSMVEPFGNIYIEALATGTPVVAHDTASTRWITEDQAILVNTQDEDAVVAAVSSALQGRAPGTVETRRALAVRRFSWEVVGGKYAEFVREVVDAAGKGTSGRSRSAAGAARA